MRPRPVAVDEQLPLPIYACKLSAAYAVPAYSTSARSGPGIRGTSTGAPGVARGMPVAGSLGRRRAWAPLCGNRTRIGSRRRDMSAAPDLGRPGAWGRSALSGCGFANGDVLPWMAEQLVGDLFPALKGQGFIFAVLLTEFDVKEFEAGRYEPP